MSNLEPKSCCDKPIKIIVLYETGQIIAVCQSHSENFEYRRGVKTIFNYKTKTEITSQEAFSSPEKRWAINNDS